MLESLQSWLELESVKARNLHTDAFQSAVGTNSELKGLLRGRERSPRWAERMAVVSHRVMKQAAVLRSPAPSRRRSPFVTDTDREERDDESTDELQIVSDGDGLAVFGPPSAVERFLATEGLASAAIELKPTGSTVSGLGAGLQAAGTLAENSGRWVKMTKESAEIVKKYELMKNSKTGLEMGVVHIKGQKGGIKHLVQFTRGAGGSLMNPAALMSIGTMMNQMALQKSIDEIAEYLAVIDEKVNDILRAQKDSVIADMIGVDLIIDDAMTTREHVGRLSDVAWSKVQGTSMTIARTQAYAIRQIEAMAEKLEQQSHVDDRAKLAKQAEATVREWLAVLAHCFRLLDGLALLELDRVLDADPQDGEAHRTALRANRDKRVKLFADTTNHLLERLETAATEANTKVLLNPFSARTVVGTSNHVGAEVAEFQRALGLVADREAISAKRWSQAVGDVRDKVMETGGAGVGAAKNLGDDAIKKARSITHRLASGIAERTRRDADAGESGQELS